ncbi:MAG TPA: ATP-binding cassette domain-containing protein [Burkholderiaceae bacterium]|nr:ATP-binding cassette domain-containing protein [Burkholderiaceae bacterium]
MSAPPALSIESLVHRRDGRTVLEVPRFELPAGARAVLVGPSGSGKTTLLSLAAGLLPTQAGRVSVAGTELAALAARGARALDRFRATRVGLVPQQPMLFGMLDALDNLLVARHLAGLPPDPGAARELLGRLGLAQLAHRRPRELSRGQQQRVALARALVNRPALILADEPTANLDDDQAAAAIELLAGQARALGAALLVATHDARVRARFETVLALPARAGADADSGEGR